MSVVVYSNYRGHASLCVCMCVFVHVSNFPLINHLFSFDIWGDQKDLSPLSI